MISHPRAASTDGIAVITIHAITIAAAILNIGSPIPRHDLREQSAEASISATSGRSAIIPPDEAALQGVWSSGCGKRKLNLTGQTAES
jgi:hypothetical protein